MIKVLKFNSKNQKIWFSSDLHWNHAPNWPVPIWKLRGFGSVEESNVYTINKINELIGANDVFFHLGDLTLNCDEPKFNQLIDSLVCQNIYCLFGNHPNPMFAVYKREVLNYFNSISNTPDSLSQRQLHQELEIYPFRYKNLIFMGNTAQIIVDKQLINLSHFSYRIFDKQHKGAWSLSGHSHNSDKERRAEHPYHKALDVGWDAKLAPYSYEEIVKIMEKKQIVKLDHHDRNTN